MRPAPGSIAVEPLGKNELTVLPASAPAAGGLQLADRGGHIKPGDVLTDAKASTGDRARRRARWFSNGQGQLIHKVGAVVAGL